MNLFNYSPNIFSNKDKDEIFEIKNYSYNTQYLDKPLPTFFEKNNDEIKLDNASYPLNDYDYKGIA